MGLSWSHFLSELERRQNDEAVIQFECKGAFLKFRSKLVMVERPAAFSAETMNLFGVVPHHVTLSFANGVRINLYMRHVETLTREGDGVVVSFKGEGGTKNSVAFYPRERRHGCAG